MARLLPSRPLAGWRPDDSHNGPAASPGGTGLPPGRAPRRRRISRRLAWTAAVILAGLVFRRAIAAVALIAISGLLHFAGLNIHLPQIRFAWPWQAAGTAHTADSDPGPWVLQKVEGISQPVLAAASFDFLFTHKVSRSLGPWPCWYASTFHAVARVPATVDLNPGPSWWAAGSGHYRLRVLSRPSAGRAGRAAVTMVLPRPRLAQSVHDITIDDIGSEPVGTQHSWTYPGFGCGVLLRPQFPQSVLYAQAQNLAFGRARHVPQVTGPLIAAAEKQAGLTVRDNFIQPTVNAFGYRLERFSLRWAPAP